MNIPDKYKARVKEWYRDSDGYWLYLNKGWRKGDNLCHILHEDTQALLLKELRRTVVCDCEYCRK